MKPTDRARDLDARELDRAIAERLGMTPVIFQEREYRERMTPLPIWSQVYEADELMFEYLPYYSTDLNDAIALVATVPQWRMTYQPNGWGGNHAADRYRVSILDEKGYHVMANQYADTPSLAICRAWLAYTAAPDTANG